MKKEITITPEDFMKVTAEVVKNVVKKANEKNDTEIIPHLIMTYTMIGCEIQQKLFKDENETKEENHE